MCAGVRQPADVSSSGWVSRTAWNTTRSEHFARKSRGLRCEVQRHFNLTLIQLHATIFNELLMVLWFSDSRRNCHRWRQEQDLVWFLRTEVRSVLHFHVLHRPWLYPVRVERLGQTLLARLHRETPTPEQNLIIQGARYEFREFLTFTNDSFVIQLICALLLLQNCAFILEIICHASKLSFKVLSIVCFF